MTTMGATDAQRLIAVSLGKIAMSRQQRGGINLHKNLLVASVLHKARTTYMMDSFQTLLANKRAQAEKEAAAKMIVETPVENNYNNGPVESMEQARGVNDCRTDNNVEVPSGECTESSKTKQSSDDKENTVPSRVVCDQNTKIDRLELKNDNVSVYKSCDRVTVNQDTTVAPSVTGKVPLSLHNGSSDYVRQLPSCRCAGNKRRRSFVDCEQMTQPKKPRYESEDEDSENSDFYDSESEFDSRSSCDESEVMNTEPSQVTSLVDVFNSGFNGLYRDNESKTENSNSSSGHINVYVSAERHNQYVLTDISCATAVKDNVSIPTAIALAV